MDPVRDKEVIDLELQIKDLETVDNRISKVQKQATTGGDREAKKALDVLLRYKEVLEKGRNAREVVLDSPEEIRIAKEFCLLTNKRVLYVCNVDEASAAKGNAYVDAVREAVKGEDAEILVISAKIESEIAELEDPEEREMFLSEIGKFWRPIYDPSIEGEKVVFKAGNAPAVGYSFKFWKTVFHIFPYICKHSRTSSIS